MVPDELRRMTAISPKDGARIAGAPCAADGGGPAGLAVERLEVAAYTVPAERPEADGTLEWDSTTVVVVHAGGGGRTGVGMTYSHRSAADVVSDVLAPVVRGRDLTEHPRLWHEMARTLRNIGAVGVGACAISAVDNALWDLKARLLGLPLAMLLGRARDAVPIYGSGGFTSMPEPRLRRQLEGWLQEGIGRVKIKISGFAGVDVPRVELARRIVGDEVELMVDANGACDRQEALRLADELGGLGVVWFEEPVSSDDLAGLRMMRERAPAGMAIAAGEYGWDPMYFGRMIAAGAVDVVQMDVTRCMGITGFLAGASAAETSHMPVSAHTAPAQSLDVCCAARPLRHMEWFVDHVRLEGMLFDGVPRVQGGRRGGGGGVLAPDLSRPGNGLELKARDAERFRVA